MIIKGYNIHVTIEAVDPEGTVLRFAMATRSLTGEVPMPKGAEQVFGKEAEFAALVALREGWEEPDRDPSITVMCADCGEPQEIRKVRCSNCATANRLKADSPEAAPRRGGDR